MLATIRSLGVKGIGGYGVSVEVFVSNGLVNFDIVGLPDAAVKEARERVRAAIKSNGFKFPVSRVTVNLAPADTKKAGTVYDLPIMQYVDVVVDGEFHVEEKDVKLLWKGSKNQRVIDVKKTLAGEHPEDAVLHCGDYK